jgi:hypothetical protein
MSGHAYHGSLPLYDPRQIWHDGCEECESRGADISKGMAYLDKGRFERAWVRAFDWGSDDDTDLGPISRAELPLLEHLWKIQVLLNRHEGWPLGVIPNAPISIL